MLSLVKHVILEPGIDIYIQQSDIQEFCFFQLPEREMVLVKEKKIDTMPHIFVGLFSEFPQINSRFFCYSLHKSCV